MHHFCNKGQLIKLLKVSGLFILLTFSLPVFAQQASSYEEAIAAADKLFNQKNYLDAKAYYQMAITFKTGDEYATKQIQAVVQQMKSGMVQEEAYFEIVDLADVFYEEGAYDKAVEQYKKALDIIPNDEYSNRKIADIQRVQTEEKDRINAYNKFMEKGNMSMSEEEYPQAIDAFKDAAILFPERALPLEKIELARQLKTEYETKLVRYNEESETASRYLLVKDYASALEHYEIALDLFPKDEAVANKIEEIRPRAENQQRYNKQVEEADELYISKDFLGAKEKYATASELWPENTYPVDMISKIENQLALQRKDLEKNYQRSISAADSMLAQKMYTEARAEYNLALVLKPNESHPKEKLQEINAYFAEQQKAFEDNYAHMLLRADSLFENADYSRAEEAYQMALEVKPDDKYPTEQLAIIESLRKAETELRQKDEAYNLLIAEADKLYENGHYDLAIKKYQEAKSIKSAEDYPAGKIAEIHQLMADAEKQKELDEAFGLQMVLGVRLFNEGRYEDSKNAYQNALELKPYDTQPKVQIARIDSLVEAKILQKQIDLESTALIAKGDSLQELKAYDQAILAYEESLKIKPKDPVAAQKLSTVKIVKLNYERSVARQKNFDEAIENGDRYLSDGSYELAQAEYKKAIEFKKEENYPKQKLAEIDKILKQLALEQQKRFDEAIVKGDNHFEQEDYQDAVLQYKIAESIKPTEKYPKQRISECNTYLAEKLKKLKAEYDIAIADADKLYATKIYDKAIKAYQDAKAIKPDEDYPQQQIDKITNLIEVNAITDVVNEKVVIPSETTERFVFEPLPINVRKSNYILIKARNVGGKSFKVIFTYGSKNGKNGGFVVQVPEGTEYNDFIIRVGNQYKWFSDDNDWLSAYPENGDVEISMIRISKSD